MKHLYIFCCISFLFFSCENEKILVDQIFYNGNIFTVDSSFSTTKAMAVTDGKIVETGTNDEIFEKYQAEESINLNAKFVYPGFIDAHCHFHGYAEGLRKVNLYGTKSFDEVLQRVIAFQNERQLEFISGRGWNQDNWPVKEFPHKQKLDSLFPDVPVYLTRVDGHASLLNQAALDYAGITKKSKIDGGIVVLDDEGELTGLLIDNAELLIEVPDIPRSEMVDALRETEEICFSYGLTTVDDAGLSYKEIAFLDSLQQADFLKMRMYIMVSAEDEDLSTIKASNKIIKERLNVSSYKFYADGALGSRGACLIHPYTDEPDQHGLIIKPKSYYEKAAEKLAKEGFQMNTHAIGDSANRMMLDIYKEHTTDKDLRWRIEHAQVVNKEDFELFAEYNVFPSVQPTHATSDMYWAEKRLGPMRLKDAYAYKKLLDQYGMIALGTDFPVEDISTLKTFYAATVRKDTSAFPENGFQPENALSREEALKGMTIWAAYSNFEEKLKGSLEKGKYADFFILDKNLLECADDEILKARVLGTYINGELVYQP